MTEFTDAMGTGFFQPTRYFLTAGRGDADWALVAFDRALIDAGIADINLVKLFGVFVGPGCHRIEPVRINPGGLVAALTRTW